MGKPEKQIIPYADLLERIQNLLLDCPKCGNLYIDDIEVYPERRGGANWDVISYRGFGDENDLYKSRELAARHIHALRACYDVIPES